MTNNSTNTKFTPNLVQQVGKIDKVLTEFLDNQSFEIQESFNEKYPDQNPELVKQLLGIFATLEGTKRPLNKDQVLKEGFDEGAVNYCLEQLENARILRLEDGVYELSHDTLALRISEQRNEEEIAELEITKIVKDRFKSSERTEVFLNAKELQLIDTHHSQLKQKDRLSLEEWDYYEKSKKKEKRKRRIRTLIISSVIGLLSVFSIITWNQKNIANEAKDAAVKLKVEADKQKEVAIKERANALEEKRKAILSDNIATEEKEKADSLKVVAIAEYKNAVSQEIKANNNWKKAERNFKIAKANELAVKARSWIGEDNTFAFRLAEAAHNLVSTKDTKDALKAVAQSDVLFYQKTIVGKEKIVAGCWSPDGNTILTGDDSGVITFWTSNGIKQKTIKAHDEVITKIVFSSDGQKIATCSKDRTAKIWKVNETSQKPFRTFNHLTAVSSVAFSPDNSKVLTSGYEKKIRLWDLNSKTEQTIPLESPRNPQTTFSPKGDYIIVNGKAGAKILNLKGNVEQLINQTNDVEHIKFSPDGNSLIYISDEKLYRQDESSETISTAIQFENPNRNELFLDFINNNEIIFFDGKSDLIIYDSKTLEESKRLKIFPKPSFSVFDYFKDEKIIYTSSEGHLRVCVLPNFSRSIKLKNLDSQILTYEFSPNENYLISAGNDSKLFFHDLSGNYRFDFDSDNESISSIDVSKNGKTIVSGGDDNKVKIWSSETGLLKKINAHSTFVNQVKISPDGTRIVSVDRNDEVKIWNSKGDLVKDLGSSEWDIHAVEFSSSSEKIIIGGKEQIRFFDKNGNELPGLKNNTSTNCLSFSPKDDFLVIGSDKGQVVFMDVKGNIIWQEKIFYSKIKSIVFSTDGKYILCGGDDDGIYLFDRQGSIRQVFKVAQGVSKVAFSNDGKTIYAVDENNMLYQWKRFDVMLTSKEIQRFEEKELDVSGNNF